MPDVASHHPDTPRGEYIRRRSNAEDEVRLLAARDARFSTARGILFLAGAVLLWMGFRGTISTWWVIPVTGIFIAAVIVHSRVIIALRQAKRRVNYYQEGLDRIRGRWPGSGTPGDRYRDPNHVYTDDLDIFGQASLFQLVCSARTRLGEDELAKWLQLAADRETILRRQQAVQELRSNIELRERLALLDAEVHNDLDQNALLEWVSIPPQTLRPAVRLFALLISGTSITLFLCWWFLGTMSSILLISLISQTVFLAVHRRLIMSVLLSVDKAGQGLSILGHVLDVMERQRFESPYLHELVSRLKVEGLPPSRTIRLLKTRIDYLNNSLRNQFFAPLAVILCLPLHLVHSIERWRELVGSHIPQWCSAVAEFEALVSLSRYAFEHASQPFPAIVEDRLVFHATEIGHPLLAEAECVCNDVSLDDDTRLLLVSGSNMSGKSTLLRTIGTNLVLGLAGAPVRAKSLELSTFQLGTAMRISDSLQEGRSLFFAVLKRIKRVVDLAEGDRPLLFLLDEILQGTNSHDRRIGAEAVIRNLIARGAIGLVTTHDLALTEIADSLPGAVNVHFADQLKNGEMTFNYQLRQGVVEKSNAIELMRLVGLDV
ncbi:MAG: hypothetical protein KDA86_14805 [Planctomycetaceae bacterium]|nr:hypothetical protein [Planctomycetaceae bacterium]